MRWIKAAASDQDISINRLPFKIGPEGPFAICVITLLSLTCPIGGPKISAG
jgi:hypothetical protein